MSMNPEIKQQWVAALRSGEYRQGKHVLHNVDENTYCCLGVLCDLAVKAGVIQLGAVDYNSEVDGDVQAYGGAGDKTTLPLSVQEWACLDDFNPDVIDNEGDESSLAGLNDEKNYTFEQLADLIEDQL